MAKECPLFAWLDGNIVPWANATIHVASEAVVRGASVFEGVAATAMPSTTSSTSSGIRDEDETEVSRRRGRPLSSRLDRQMDGARADSSSSSIIEPLQGQKFLPIPEPGQNRCYFSERYPTEVRGAAAGFVYHPGAIFSGRLARPSFLNGKRKSAAARQVNLAGQAADSYQRNLLCQAFKASCFGFGGNSAAFTVIASIA